LKSGSDSSSYLSAKLTACRVEIAAIFLIFAVKSFFINHFPAIRRWHCDCCAFHRKRCQRDETSFFNLQPNGWRAQA
jgi:hypothetical protein